MPKAKRVGMVFNPGEANSAVVVEQLQTLLPQRGMTLVEAAAPRSVDVSSAARSLIGKVDVIYTSTDNNVVSAYEALVKVRFRAKIPLIASDTDSVKRGAIAALGIDTQDLGVQTGRMVVRILKGEKARRHQAETSTKLELFVNPGAAEKQGVQPAEAWLSRPPRSSSKPAGTAPGPVSTPKRRFRGFPGLVSCLVFPSIGGLAHVAVFPVWGP